VYYIDSEYLLIDQLSYNLCFNEITIRTGRYDQKFTTSQLAAHRPVTLRLPSDVSQRACLVDIAACLKASRLQLNPTKTQVMWLDSSQS